MDRKSLHVIHVLAPAPFGGLETVVRTLATGHAALGHRVTIAAVVEDGANPFVAAMRADGIPVTEILSRRGHYGAERHDFRALLSATAPHVVHSHGYRTDIVELPVARSVGIANVTTFHGFTGGNWKLRLYERFQVRRARATDAAIAVSTGVQRRLIAQKVAAHQVHLIRNAYSPRGTMLSRAAARDAAGVPRDGIRIGWIGRLSKEKGPDIMLAAMALLRDTAVMLSVVGDGSQRAMLEAQAQQLGIGNRVRFHGTVTDASRLLPAFDVLALTSRTEGTPMVLLEAMATETPIVATRVGGVPDMLSSEEASLVELERPDLLAAAIRSALADPESTITRARAARQRLLTDFSEEAWLGSYLALYESLLR